MSRTVLFVCKGVPRYRVPFFDSLRTTLTSGGVDLRLVYGQGSPREAHRNEGVDVDWGTRRDSRVVRCGDLEALWQPCLREARTSDLVIVEQASRLLVNYALLTMQGLGGTRVAFWGHGANLQAHTAAPGSEWLKRRVSQLPHWWFAYTEGSKSRVTSLGYPGDRVTVVQNAQDTEDLTRAVAAIDEPDRRRFREQHDLGDGPVCLFLGSLYPEKRVDFLLEAAARVAASIPGFRLLVVGDGIDRKLVLDATCTSPWIRCTGRLSSLEERAVALSVSDLLLMPGLVGLVALDSFAAGVPLVTTAVDYHSPEIEYVADGENGVVCPDPDDVDAYAAEVVRLLEDRDARSRLVRGGERARELFTLQAMVDRFAGGIHAALETR